MGRTIKIELTDEQRAELERGYRHGATHVFRQRCHMVLLKADQRTSADVAEIVGVCPQTVNGWLWRYKQAGITGLETQPGQGRRAILQVTEDAAAVRDAVAEHRQRLTLARAALEDRLGKRFSEKTLRRFLKNSVADINVSASAPPKRKSKKFITSK
ncbi:MAG: helix-turn-helix domain-containing protein [Chloroflexota bacterium]|nr:helix-turn-helix domain-containing protein [Chloroflexota bacterium]